MYSKQYYFQGFRQLFLSETSFLSSRAESIIPVFLLPKFLATTAKRTVTFIKKAYIQTQTGLTDVKNWSKTFWFRDFPLSYLKECIYSSKKRDVQV